MSEGNVENKEPEKFSNRQRVLIAVILLSALTGVGIGLMRVRGVDGSALLYIGLPTIIALAFATTSSSKTIMGSTLKAITFVILISGPLLQEGYICMIMAAPIFYIAGALAAWIFGHFRDKKKNMSRLNMFVLPSLLLLMSMEGVFDATSFNRFNTVEHVQIIDGSVSDIKKRMAGTRSLSAPDSLFAKIFPRPDMVNANGLSVGDRQWIDVSYFKWIYWNEKRGRVQFEVVEHNDYYLRFKPAGDTSYFSSYLTWKDTTVSFQPITDNRTRVTWRISFQRDIDPAWYAQPLQRYAVTEAAKVLVGSLQ